MDGNLLYRCYRIGRPDRRSRRLHDGLSLDGSASATRWFCCGFLYGRGVEQVTARHCALMNAFRLRLRHLLRRDRGRCNDRFFRSGDRRATAKPCGRNCRDETTHYIRRSLSAHSASSPVKWGPSSSSRCQPASGWVRAFPSRFSNATISHRRILRPD